MDMEVKPRRFCSYRSCMETLCVIFAIINAVICLLAFLNSLLSLVFVVGIWIWPYSVNIPLTDAQREVLEAWAITINLLVIGAVICVMATALPLCFAVLLLLGIKNDNKRYIKMYLQYGVIVVTLSVLGLLLYIWVLWEQAQIDAVFALGFCLAHSGILFLIYKTYLGSDRQETNNILLSASSVPQSYGSQ